MINITIKYLSSGEFHSLTSKGHANSDALGHDLVCAAVSGILLGGINALKGKNFTLKSDEIKGIIELTNVGKMDAHDNIVIETIIAQLTSVSRDNPKFIKVSIE